MFKKKKKFDARAYYEQLCNVDNKLLAFIHRGSVNHLKSYVHSHKSSDEARKHLIHLKYKYAAAPRMLQIINKGICTSDVSNFSNGRFELGDNHHWFGEEYTWFIYDRETKIVIGLRIHDDYENNYFSVEDLKIDEYVGEFDDQSCYYSSFTTVFENDGNAKDIFIITINAYMHMKSNLDTMLNEMRVQDLKSDMLGRYNE